MRQSMIFPAIASLSLAGCAGIEFHDSKPTGRGAFEYRTYQPFLVIERAADCTTKVSTTTQPGAVRYLRFHSGIGSSKLSVALANGMVTSLGQETDTKIPETITAVAGAAKTASSFLDARPAAPKCGTSTTLYRIGDDGKVDPKPVVGLALPKAVAPDPVPGIDEIMRAAGYATPDTPIDTPPANDGNAAASEPKPQR